MAHGLHEDDHRMIEKLSEKKLTLGRHLINIEIPKFINDHILTIHYTN